MTVVFRVLFIIVPFTQDIIGIITNKVGIGSTQGTYVGVNSSLLEFFTSIPTLAGTTQSFKTVFNNVITGKVDKNVVTLGLGVGNSHSLRENDNIIVSIKPNDTISVDVRYNSYNRRMVFDPQGFTTTGVDTSVNLININNHGYFEGDKVLYTSDNIVGGLTNNGMYYVVPFTDDAFRLVENKSDVYSSEPNFIELTTQNNGVLSKINPPVEHKETKPLDSTYLMNHCPL